MSWDLFVFDFPSAAKSVRELPPQYRPTPIAARSDLMRQIMAASPRVRSSDPSWGAIDMGAFSVEISLGSADPVHSFAFHVRGDDGPFANEAAGAMIAQILDRLKLRAIDSRTGEIFAAA
jgi:hypothetical protein